MISPSKPLPPQFAEILDLAKLVFHDKYFELYDRLPTTSREGDINFHVQEEYHLDQTCITADVLTPQGIMRAGYSLSKAEVLDHGPNALYLPACSIVNNLGRNIFDHEWVSITPEDIGFARRVDREDRYTTIRDRPEYSIEYPSPPKVSWKPEQDPVQKAPEPKPEIKRSEDFGAW